MLCNPISVPEGDSRLINQSSCINFVRSVPIQNLECSGSPIEQVNQITHWLDNSNIYGSLPVVAKSVRSNQDGLLKSDRGNDAQEQLPIDPNPAVECRGPTQICALAGNLLANLIIRKHHIHQHFF